MKLLSKRTVVYAVLCLLLVACSVQGFYNYHNWKVRQWCDHFGFSYTMLGGPPKSWEWPWNWSMVHSLYVSRYENPYQFPDPSLDDVGRLVGHARYVPRLSYVDIGVPVRLNEVLKMRNLDQLIIRATIKYADDEKKLVKESMPNTIVTFFE